MPFFKKLRYSLPLLKYHFVNEKMTDTIFSSKRKTLSVQVYQFCKNEMTNRMSSVEYPSDDFTKATNIQPKTRITFPYP